MAIDARWSYCLKLTVARFDALDGGADGGSNTWHYGSWELHPCTLFNITVPSSALASLGIARSACSRSNEEDTSIV
eukprot:5933272-Amphidinium_carterae.3